jgi:hypothetical protein
MSPIRTALIIITCSTHATAQPSHDTCVDVQVGSAQSYECINQKLAATAHQAHNAGAQAPYSANSPGNVTGQFNESATRNRLGTNFGKSVTPERPPAVYTPPFTAPRT